ncbi:MAG: hypothetical protein DMF61_25765 [Blastocatellia bacterium AA13]|nr:MAG: hypothetical protein DMF61_25765 [Blastocatellia bacterium AA13]
MEAVKIKLVILILYGLVLAAPGVLFARPSPGIEQTADRLVVRLDERGTRGPVKFDHTKHETTVNPDPNAKFKTKVGASCSGCHHTENKSTGAPQLWKCVLCHRSSGNPANPKNDEWNELWSKTAFHKLCVDCHQVSKKGPVKCGDCHKSNQ